MHTVRTYDLFLVVSRARDTIGRLPLIGLEATARLMGVDAYYRADTDVALIRMRLDGRATTGVLLDRVRAQAAAAQLAVLEPSRLEDDDRARFYREHLTAYPLHVLGFPTVADAARLLAHDLGLAVARRAAGEAPRVEVRFRSGEHWYLGRARTLSREGMYIYSGATLRSGELVALRLEADGVALSVHAVVVHVTTEDAAAMVGGQGFAARFLLRSPDDRRALERIVVAGRRDGLEALRGAPPRREARYRLRWPVAIAGSPPVAALDVSQHGLFVATLAPVRARQVEVKVASDDQGATMRARARVARTLSGPAADARGVTAGYGLELGEFSPGDEARFRGFVARVGQRARRRLLVGARAARLRQLLLPLTAAGYVVTGASDAVELATHAAATPPDLVLLDATLPVGPRRLGTDVLCYQVEAEQSGREIRALADAALL